LNGDDRGNIYNKNGNEAMDIVDEKPEAFTIKQLVNFDSHLERKTKAQTSDLFSKNLEYFN
jgi:hypothetical protein